MKVLVACEFSGTVRDAFNRAGHDAMSCDLLPTETPGPHYQGSCLDLLAEPYDLVIAHPPCTYLTNSGVQHLYKSPDRWLDMEEGAEFFWSMSQFNSPRIAIENPVQHRHAVSLHGMGSPSQYVQPYMFGEPQFKRTGLWLFNLPKLVPTEDVKWMMELLPKRETMPAWYGATSHGPERWKHRSKTFQGVADAMVSQWGQLTTEPHNTRPSTRAIV